MAKSQEALQHKAEVGAPPSLLRLKSQVVETCEPKPGVYRFSCAGQTIYIGRSKSLRARLLSYFRAERGQKAFTIARSADALSWEYTASEFASHLAELDLIKEFRPTYNWALKDEDEYVFVRVGEGPAPRLVLSREPDGYGPFRSPRRIEAALRRLSDLLGLRTSPDSVPLFALGESSGREPRCMRGQLGLCAAPCAGRADLLVYAEKLDAARRFLSGDEPGLIVSLQTKMREAAARLEFERAALYRDRAEELSALYTELRAWREELDWLTLVYAVPGEARRDRLYFLHGGRVVHSMARPRRAAEWARAREHASSLLAPVRAPQSGREVDEIKVVASWFRSHPEEIERAQKPSVFVEKPAWISPAP
jgi:excinuclease ABC subunit C